MIGVGIAGAGFMGKTHATVYEQIEDAKLVAVADLSLEKAREIVKDPDVKVYESYEDLIANPDVEVVDICLPTFLHADCAVKAAQAAKHVLCEKPMALDLDQADRMIEAASETGVKLMIAHVIRFWPEYQELRKISEKGDLGAVKSLACTRLSAAPEWTWRDWVLQKEKSGSAVLDLHIHDADFIMHLLGRPISVYSQGTPEHIFTIYEYDRDVLAFAEGGWNLPKGFQFRMSYMAVFEKGLVEFISDRTPSVLVYLENGEKYAPEIAQPTISAAASGGNISAIAGYYNEIEYFLGCIGRGEEPKIVTPQDARASLELITKEVESVKTGEKVSL